MFHEKVCLHIIYIYIYILLSLLNLISREIQLKCCRQSPTRCMVDKVQVMRYPLVQCFRNNDEIIISADAFGNESANSPYLLEN